MNFQTPGYFNQHIFRSHRTHSPWHWSASYDSSTSDRPVADRQGGGKEKGNMDPSLARAITLITCEALHLYPYTSQLSVHRAISYHLLLLSSICCVPYCLFPELLQLLAELRYSLLPTFSLFFYLPPFTNFGAFRHHKASPRRHHNIVHPIGYCDGGN